MTMTYTLTELLHWGYDAVKNVGKHIVEKINLITRH